MKLSALSLIFFTSMLIHTAPHAAANISLASTAPLNNWYPQGGSHSNTVALTFNIQNPARKGRVNFRLENTTNWKGYCTNIGTQTGPDLQLLSGDQTDNTVTWSQQTAQKEVRASWSNGGPAAITLIVSAKDFAAYGELSAVISQSRGEPSAPSRY